MLFDPFKLNSKELYKLAALTIDKVPIAQKNCLIAGSLCLSASLFPKPVVGFLGFVLETVGKLITNHSVGLGSYLVSSLPKKGYPALISRIALGALGVVVLIKSSLCNGSDDLMLEAKKSSDSPMSNEAAPPCESSSKRKAFFAYVNSDLNPRFCREVEKRSLAKMTVQWKAELARPTLATEEASERTVNTFLIQVVTLRVGYASNKIGALQIQATIKQAGSAAEESFSRDFYLTKEGTARVVNPKKELLNPLKKYAIDHWVDQFKGLMQELLKDHAVKCNEILGSQPDRLPRARIRQS
jgi:hypothetical protein